MTKKINLRPRWVVAGAVALAVCIAAVLLAVLNPFAKSSSQKSSSQSDFRVFGGPPMGTIIEYSLEECVQMSDVIVEATVKQVGPLESNAYVPEEGSAEQKIQEEKGINPIIIKSYNVQLTVNEAIAGECESEVTLYIGPIRMDTVPEFQPGDHMLFFLSKFEDRYSMTTFKGSLYYIAFDNKVYPAHLNDELQRISGKNLDAFKSEIRSLAQKS